MVLYRAERRLVVTGVLVVLRGMLTHPLQPFRIARVALVAIVLQLARNVVVGFIEPFNQVKNFVACDFSKLAYSLIYLLGRGVGREVERVLQLAGWRGDVFVGGVISTLSARVIWICVLNGSG